MTRDEAEIALGEESEALFCDGYDDCILGIAERFGMEPVVAYDYGKMIEKMVLEGMTEEDAQEHFNFNIIGAWVGEGTPIFVRTAG